MKPIKIIFCLVLVQHAISANQGFNPKLLPSFFALYDNQNKPPKQTIPAGTLDLTFGKGTGYVTTGVSLSNTVQNNITSMAVDQQNRYITVGSILKTDGDQNLNIALFRFLSDGTLDKGFGVGGYVIYNQTPPHDSSLNSVVVDAHNGIIAGGTVQPDFLGSVPVFYLMRYLDNGTIDDNFLGGQFSYSHLGFTVDNNFTEAVTLDSQGRIILVGYTVIEEINANADSFFVLRYDSLGQVDTSFGLGIPGAFNSGEGYTVYTNNSDQNNIPYAVATDSQDNIIAVGVNGINLEVVKFFGSDGSTDDAFNGNVPHINNFIGYSIAIDAEDNIYIGGNQPFGGIDCLIKLKPDGTLDTTFGVNGFFSIPGTLFECRTIAIDPLNRIVIMGFDGFFHHDFIVARLFSDGTLDTSFGNAGVSTFTTTNSAVYSGALDQHGRIIVAGNNDDGQDDSLPELIAFTTDYSFDYYKSQFNNQPVGLLG